MFCLQCGYPLKQLSGHHCPECGRPFDPQQSATFAATVWRYRMHRARRAIMTAAIGLPVAIVLYVASYYASVQLNPPGGTGVPPWQRSAIYPFNHKLAHRIYIPMETFDQWLRPQAWEYWGVAQECVPGFRYVLSQEWPPSLQADAEALWSVIYATGDADGWVNIFQEDLARGEGTREQLDAAIAHRDELVAKALEAEKQFRAKVTSIEY